MLYTHTHTLRPQTWRSVQPGPNVCVGTGPMCVRLDGTPKRDRYGGRRGKQKGRKPGEEEEGTRLFTSYFKSRKKMSNEAKLKRRRREKKRESSDEGGERRNEEVRENVCVTQKDGGDQR